MNASNEWGACCRAVRRLLIIALISYVLVPSYGAASTYLDVNDEANGLLARLEAEGVITSGLLTTRPLSRKEVARLLLEAERNAEGRSAFIRSLVQELKQRLGPEDPKDIGLSLLDTGCLK